MKVISKISLTSFEFWGGAKERAKMLTYEEIEEIGIFGGYMTRDRRCNNK